jgi:opine dehydrogenase
MNITVIGAGNGGQAIAGYLGMLGHDVCLYNRDLSKIYEIAKSKIITLTGKIEGVGKISVVTENIEIAVKFAELIMVVTTANAHRELATKIVNYLKQGQIIVLNPGRTCGLLEFKNSLSVFDTPKVHIAEAQTLIYACRAIKQGVVNIIGIKDRVLLAAENKDETNFVIDKLSNIWNCFYPGENYFHTSLENIGAIFHPPIVLFNAAAIERGEEFFFYRDMTQSVANFIIDLDKERLKIGSALGLSLISAENWISCAYNGITGNNLLEKIKNNPAYYNIISPASIYSRQLLEDLPTGLVPMSEFGKSLKVQTPLIDSVIEICSSLLQTDFRKHGRTLDKLGLKGGLLCLDL